MRQWGVTRAVMAIAMICSPVAAWAAERTKSVEPQTAQPESATPTQSHQPAVGETEQQAVRLKEAQLKTAQALTRLDPSTRLTYASILFYQARRLMQIGNQAAAQDAFRRVEHELVIALKNANHEPDLLAQNLVGSQSAFMLGDLYMHVFQDAVKAKQFYQDALKFFPEHDGAIEALKRLQ